MLFYHPKTSRPTPPKKSHMKGQVHLFFLGGWEATVTMLGGFGRHFKFMDWGEGDNWPWNWLLPRQPHIFWPEPQGSLNDEWLFRPHTLTKKRFDSFWDHLKNGKFYGVEAGNTKNLVEKIARIGDNISAHVHLNVAVKSTTKMCINM